MWANSITASSPSTSASPESWDADRERCRAAGSPDDVRYRPKWRIAQDQRLNGNGVTFDGLVFDEGYGSAVPFTAVTAADAHGGQRYRLARRAVADAVWRAAAVWAARRPHTLVVAVHEATAEVKAFRLGKQEAGLLDDEGRDDTGLIRHLIQALVVLGFVAVHTEQLRVPLGLHVGPPLARPLLGPLLGGSAVPPFRRLVGSFASAPFPGIMLVV